MDWIFQRGAWANFFWWCQIWDQKKFRIFPLQSTLDFEFVSGGRSGHQLFLVMPNVRSKIFWNFFIYTALWTLNFFIGRSGHQIFLVTLNFRPKILQNFFLYQALWTEFFRGRSGPTFFGDAKFDLKKFSEFYPLLSALDSEFFWGRGVWASTIFGHAKFEVKIFSEFFILQNAMDSEFFTGGSGHQLILVTPNFRSNFFWNFLLYCTLWPLNLSGRGVWAPSFFGHTKFEVKNFWEFFHLQSAVDSESFAQGSGHQLFMVMLNLRLKIFQNFFLYWEL